MENLTVILILIAFIGLMTAGIVEKWRHRRNLKQIPIRILVNGTRGKTTVTRLITAVLQASGIRTWGKVTGTQAAYLLPDGREMEYRGRRPVNIREQIPFIRRAREDGAQAVVVECMAIRAENQEMMAREFVRPTIVVITNSRIDHVTEMGNTETETMETLLCSIPKNAQVVCLDPEFDQYLDHRISGRVRRIDPEYMASFSYPMFEENVRLTLAVSDLLKIDRQTAYDAMLRVRPDVGMQGMFRHGKCVVVNAFAANDSESTEKIVERLMTEERKREEKQREKEEENRRLTPEEFWELWKPREKFLLIDPEKVGLLTWERPVWVLFNNRADREFRLEAFLPFLNKLDPEYTKLVVMGENRKKACRYFSRQISFPCEVLTGSPLQWLDQVSQTFGAVLCIGNIRGEGKTLIEALQAEEKPQETSGEASEEASEEKAKSKTEKTAKEEAQKAPEETADGKPEKAPEETADGKPEKASEETAKEEAQKAPEETEKKEPEKKPEA